MSKKIRLIALILTVVMLIGVMPISLFAQDEADAPESVTEETSVLDYLASQATGTDYTMMAFSDLLEKIDGTTTFIANGSYGDADGDGVAEFIQNFEGATKENTPGPNNQKSSLKWVNGEAQLLDSIVSLNTDGAAKTDITYNFTGSPNFTDQLTKSPANNGKTVFVASYEIKPGEAYAADYLGRFRIYTTPKTATYVNGDLTETIKGKQVRSERNIFTYDTATGVLKVDGTAAGAFSTDDFVTITVAYDYEADDIYTYVNGVYIKTIENLLQGFKFYNDVETWTKGKDTEDTTDDNYTKVTYSVDKILLDAHYGTQGVLAGRLLSVGDVRTYISTKASVFGTTTDGAVDPKSYIEANQAPKNGVFKIGDSYYYFENGIIQCNKTVKVGNFNLVLEKKSGKITDYYVDRDIYSGMTEVAIGSVENTLSKTTDIKLIDGLNNNKDRTAYRFVKDEAGAYSYLKDADGNYTYAAVSGDKLYSVSLTDGVYAFVLADSVKEEATIDSTYAYAPLLDSDGKQVTFQDGETTVNVLAKANVEEYTVRGNILTHLGDGIYEFTSKAYTSTPTYYSSTTNLSIGTTTKYDGADFQISASAGTSADITRKYEYVYTFDIKAGAGLYNQTLNAITFGKIRWNMDAGNAKEGRAEDNNFFRFVKKEDGKYHLEIQGTDCGVLSKNEYTNVTAVFTVDKDGYYEIAVYVNGVNVLPTTTYYRDYFNSKQKLSDAYHLQTVGAYTSASPLTWNEPLIYMGNAHVYSAEKGNIALPEDAAVDVKEAFTGYVKFDDGTYGKYENNILVADGLTEANYAVLNAQNVVLADRIGLNFYLDASALASDEGAKAVFTVGNETQTVYLKDAETTEDGTKLTAWLSSVQMNTPVTLEIYNGDGEKTTIAKDAGLYECYSYTVREYAEYIVANSKTYGTAAVNAAKSMVLYGAFAERYFNGESGLAATGTTVNNLERAAVQFQSVGTVVTGLTISSDTMTATTKVYEGVDKTGTATDTTKVGAIQLVLDSSLKIRITLNVTEAPKEITGGELRTFEEDGVTKYCVDITGINVSEFNDVKEVTVDGNTIKISVLAVAAQVVQNESVYGNDFADLMRALYGYYYYSAIYAGKITVE